MDPYPKPAPTFALTLPPARDSDHVLNYETTIPPHALKFPLTCARSLSLTIDTRSRGSPLSLPALVYMKPLCPATNLTTQQQSELTVPQVDHTQSTPATCPTENFEMMSPAPNSGGSEIKYWGVRKRKWGKWVSEVRLPNSRERIWLGSYDSPEKAARAFDAAAFCLRGHQARLNYPGDLPRVPPIAVTRSWTHQQIRAAAATHAHSAPTETEVPENSPMVPASEESEEATEVSVSEASEEVGTAVETPVPDWSYLDLMTTNGFPLVDDFYYDFMALVDGAPGLTVDAAAEEGGGGFEASTVLWNFHDS